MLELYKPQLEELWFKEKMMSDEPTMAYNHAYGGTIPFPKERWAAWYAKWINNNEGKRFYRYVKSGCDFVGEAAYRFDEERQIYIADVIIYVPYRGRGYGRNALLLLCQAAKEAGICELYDDIAIDNSSLELFLKCGFTEALRTSEYISVKKEL